MIPYSVLPNSSVVQAFFCGGAAPFFTPKQNQKNRGKAARAAQRRKSRECAGPKQLRRKRSLDPVRRGDSGSGERRSGNTRFWGLRSRFSGIRPPKRPSCRAPNKSTVPASGQRRRRRGVSSHAADSFFGEVGDRLGSGGRPAFAFGVEGIPQGRVSPQGTVCSSGRCGRSRRSRSRPA